MAMYWRNKLLLLKKELTYGTDAAPLAANAVRGHDVNFTPMELTTEDLESIQPYMGAGDTDVTSVSGKLEWSVQAAGSGTAGTAPAYGTCLLVSGLAETVTAATRVDYTPVSSAFDAGSVYFYLDGDLHKFTGVRANVSFTLEAGKTPYWRFTAMGLYKPVTTASLPAGVDYSAYKRPVMPSKTDTPTVTLHGYAALLKSLTIDLGQQAEYDQLVNDESVDIGGRSSKAKIVIRRPPVATKDFFAAARARTLGALAIEHGTVAGNIVAAAAPKAQIVRVGQTTDKGKVYLDMDLSLKPDAGNDEIVFTIK